MNTWFEILLLGEDPENLHAAGEAALDEIERIEKLLSRFDPSSEVSRVNREAARSPVLLDFELSAVIESCREGWIETNGYFDIAATRHRDTNFSAVDFNPDARLILFRNADVRLDFGGFGKGYALDCAARLLREVGVDRALLHGGTSSVLAIGSDADGQPWRVGLRNPWNKEAPEGQVHLSDNALSTSSTGESVSDILHPHSGRPLEKEASCTVISESAARAEIFSTGLLLAGEDQARQVKDAKLKVLWMTPSSAQPSIIL